MTLQNGRILAITATVAATLGCGELEVPRDVSGTFDVTYVDNLRVYLDDTLVAEVASGEDATIEWDGQTFQVSQICDMSTGTVCPGDSFWGIVGVDQPQGDGHTLLNFVNLDPELGTLGQRMGGLMEEDGHFTMLSGLDLGSNEACAAVGVGTVEGTFTAGNTRIDDGTILYSWAGGCSFGGVALGTTVRLETDYTARRTGDLDLSSVSAEEPIDEQGEEL